MSATPTAYTRQYDFEDFQSDNPTTPLPADQVENELNAVKTAMDTTQSRLAEIQRDDGALANEIVTPDSLSEETLAILIGEINPRGAWVTATAYAVDDMVRFTDGASYLCVTAHTSGTFATDLAADKWMLFANPITASGTPFYQKFTGTGAQVNFTLSVNFGSTDEKIIQVFVAGAIKDPLLDYTISGTTLGFNAAPANGAKIEVWGVNTIAQAAISAALAAQAAAELAEANAETAETNAELAETNAEAAQAAAETARNQAQAAQAAAEAAATSGLFAQVQDKSADYTVAAADEGDLLRYDLTAAGRTLTLPQISSLGLTGTDAFSIGAVKQTGSDNLTVQRSGADTINGGASVSLTVQYEVYIFTAKAGSTEWNATPLRAIGPGSITATELATNAVTTIKIQDDAVTQDKIADNAVGTAQLRNSEVTVEKLEADAKRIAFSFEAGWGADGSGEDLVDEQLYGYVVAPVACTLTGQQGYIETAGTGADVEMDVELNGVTIFSTRPEFAAGANTLTAGTISTTAIPAGSRLGFRIKAIGSTVAGQKLGYTLVGTVD